MTAADRARLDITDADAEAASVAGHDVVVNAAAWTDVDGAEAGEAAATTVNGHAMAGMARACGVAGAWLIQISTDYVFRGSAGRRYPERDPPDPVNAYGRGKLTGERAVRGLLPRAGLLVRTAWLYGAGGGNFVATMLRLAHEHDTVAVVNHQVGSPPGTVALAAQVAALGRAAAGGVAPPGIPRQRNVAGYGEPQTPSSPSNHGRRL